MAWVSARISDGLAYTIAIYKLQYIDQIWLIVYCILFLLWIKSVAYLILDLDLTVWASEKDLHKVHGFHQRTTESFPLSLSCSKELKVALLNPDLLALLIEHACTQHDGVIFLSAGYWDEIPAKNLLLDKLRLSELAKEKLLNADFLTPMTTQDQFSDLSPLGIKSLLKNTRLNHHIQRNPHLAKKGFVFIDDRAKHISSCDEDSKVIAIKATPKQASTSFYRDAIAALDRMKQQELTMASSSSTALQEFDDPAVHAVHLSPLEQCDFKAAERWYDVNLGDEPSSATSHQLNSYSFYYSGTDPKRSFISEIDEALEQGLRPINNSPALEDDDAYSASETTHLRQILSGLSFLNRSIRDDDFTDSDFEKSDLNQPIFEQENTPK